MPSPNQPSYRDEHLIVDLVRQVVTLDSEILALTRIEYRLLAVLVERAGQVVPRTVILTQVWGSLPEPRTRTLDVHMRGVRRKLGPYAAHYIETVVGVGYRFKPFQPRG